MNLGIIFLVIAATLALIFFETMKSIPEEGRWARPKFVALEVIIAGLVIFGVISLW